VNKLKKTGDAIQEHMTNGVAKTIDKLAPAAALALRQGKDVLADIAHEVEWVAVGTTDKSKKASSTPAGNADEPETAGGEAEKPAETIGRAGHKTKNGNHRRLRTSGTIPTSPCPRPLTD
jgi:hypothetical protein